jgi:hypothetical protein
MLGTVLISVAGVLVVFAAVVAMRASAFRVARTLEISAPAELVFAIVNDLRQFTGLLVFFGTPWDKLDPGMQKTFSGPTAGVGQSCAWRGKKVGAGTLTIEGSTVGRDVRMKLEFLEPMKSTSTCALTVAATSSGSVVKWSMAGNHNFIGKAFGLFMNMDKMLASDLDKGLALLKAAAERQQGGSVAAAVAEPDVARA